MAGHRRTNGKNRPLQASRRGDNRRAYADQRLAAADTPSDRVQVASAALRAELRHTDTATAADVAERVVALLIQHTDRLRRAAETERRGA